jgi:Gas vesicle synthesis protein GvpL/GvpF
VIELVAITDDRMPARPPTLEVRYNGLRAFGIPVQSSRQITPEELWQREELLESLMEEGDVLPARFGSMVEDERALARTLAARCDEFVAMLQRVRGAVELAVRVQDAKPTGHQEWRVDSGRAYMLSKARQMESAAALHDPLASLARESVMRPCPEVLRAAYLVDRGRVEDFIGRVRALQRTHPQRHILCTGPWPPYSFVDTENQ